MQGRAPISVRVWCDALLAADKRQLKWLARDRESLAVINDPFVAYNPIEQKEMTMRLATWATASLQYIHKDRIRFLIKHCAIELSEAALTYAVKENPVDWEFVSFLERHGARYTQTYFALKHLDKLRDHFNSYSREALEFAWRYHRIGLIEPDGDLIWVAYFRMQRARHAAVAVAGMKKKLNKDVASLIGRYLVAPGMRVDPAWGRPGFVDSVRENKWKTLLIVLCICLLVEICWYALFFVQPPQLPFVCDRPDWDCSIDDRGSPVPGPPGPPGICAGQSPDFVTSSGVGIQIGPWDPKQEITIDNSNVRLQEELE